MSRLSAVLRHVFAWLVAPSAGTTTEIHFSPAEWADLPPHHPLRDEAPC